MSGNGQSYMRINYHILNPKTPINPLALILNSTSTKLSTKLCTNQKSHYVWLVTGCSSGLGQTLVPSIIARGDIVIATARNVQDLQHLKQYDNVHPFQLDITESEEILQQKVAAFCSLFGRLDVLVNNAGHLLSSIWEEASSKIIGAQFQTNFFGTMNLTGAVLPHMRSNRSGTIIFMGSVAGCKGAPALGPYGSSKASLERAAECLEKEVCGLGIRVHMMLLGRFRTNILDPKNIIAYLDPTKGIQDYSTIKTQAIQYQAATNGAQPGDPLLAAERLVDIVKMKNMQRDQLPLLIPLGSDAVRILRYRSNELLSLLENWTEFASSTDYKEKMAAPDFER